jgi:hypothetical protein
VIKWIQNSISCDDLYIIFVMVVMPLAVFGSIGGSLWKEARDEQIRIERIEATGPLAGKSAREMVGTFNLHNPLFDTEEPSAFILSQHGFLEKYRELIGEPPSARTYPSTDELLAEVYYERLEWPTSYSDGSRFGPCVTIKFEVNPCSKTVRMALAHDAHNTFDREYRRSNRLNAPYSYDWFGRWEPLTWEEYEDILIMYHSILAYGTSRPHQHSRGESLRLGRESFENLRKQARDELAKEWGTLCHECRRPHAEH